MGKKVVLETDLVVLTTPLIPAEDNRQLSRMLKVPIGNEGFFMEAHQKLRPVEFPADGIFIAGCARYPADISECVAQGYAAAAKAAVPMARQQVVTEAFTSEVNPLRCSACGRCVEICPFDAVSWAETRNAEGEIADCPGEFSRVQGLRIMRGVVYQRRPSVERIHGRADPGDGECRHGGASGEVRG